MDFVVIKPLSVNEAWRGQRFKTDKYKKYEIDLMCLLPKLILPDAPYEVHYVFGLSNLASDIDNCVKQFQDCLSKKYEFNDKLIMKMTVEKKIVAKGKEYAGFEFKTINPI